MNKLTIFKITLSLALMVFATQVFAQQDMADLSEHEEYQYAGGTWEDADDDGNSVYMTVGSVLPFVVAPDAVYSPNYDFGADPNAVNGSTWAWIVTNAADVDQSWTITEPGDLSGKATNAGVGRSVDYSAFGGDGLVGENFALVTAGATPGLFYLKATETNGSCSDAAPTEIRITVFAAPTIAIDDAQDDAYDDIAGGNCGLLDNETFEITLTGYQNYNIVWSIDVDNVDAGDNVIDYLDGDADAGNPSGFDYDHDLTLTGVERTSSGNLADNADAPSTYAIADGGTDFDAATGTVNQDVLTVTKDFEVENSAITRYTYTFTSVNDQISRKSNYWSDAAYTTYTPVTTSLVYYVKPTPNTGHIYVIPN